METDQSPVLVWLLQEDYPAVRLRALKNLCHLPDNDDRIVAARRLVKQTLKAASRLSWMELNGQALVYNLTALAEAGLSRYDVPIDPIVDRLLGLPFDVNCGEMMLLRALLMLGYSSDSRIEECLTRMSQEQLPDGGWLCLHRLNHMKRIPKSCIKANIHALLLAAELHRCGVTLPWCEPLIAYFRRRHLFYRMDDPARLVLDCSPGYRMVDVHVPIEYMRVGLPYLVAALAELGQRATPEFQEAWQLLERKKDSLGRVCLEGTLAKSYLPKERVGRPTKWGTLYACMAAG